MSNNNVQIIANRKQKTKRIVKIFKADGGFETRKKKKEFFVFVCVIVRPKRHAVFLLMSIVRRVNCLLINNLNIFGIYQSAMIRDIFFFSHFDQSDQY